MAAKDVLSFVLDNLTEPERYNRIEKIDVGRPIPVGSFDALMEEFRNRIYMTRTAENVMAMLLAVHISTKLPDEPLWLHLVAPPSSGKTTLIQALAADTARTHSVSKLTGFVSGWKDTPDDESDHSLIPLINGRTLLIKDFTSILTLPVQTQETFFGELRELYDGEYKVHYRNKISRKYDNVHFTIITGVTDEIHALDRTELGERFLKIDLIDAHTDPGKFVKRALKSSRQSFHSGFERMIEGAKNGQTVGTSDDVSGDDEALPTEAITSRLNEDFVHIQRCTAGFMNNFFSTLHTKSPPALPKWIDDKIEGLAQIVAVVRAKVKRTGRDRDLIYRPRRESGPRLGVQLQKAALCLKFITDWEWSRVYEVIRKVAFDTAWGLTLEIITEIAKAPNSKRGLSPRQICLNTGIAMTSIVRRLEDLEELKAITRVKQHNGTENGAMIHRRVLAPDVMTAWELVMDSNEQDVSPYEHKRSDIVREKRRSMKRRKIRKFA